jgi:hypothetical protein
VPEFVLGLVGSLFWLDFIYAITREIIIGFVLENRFSLKESARKDTVGHFYCRV